MMMTLMETLAYIGGYCKGKQRLTGHKAHNELTSDVVTDSVCHTGRVAAQ